MQKFVAIYSVPRAEINKFLKMPKDKMQKAVREDMKLWNAWFKKNKKHMVNRGEIFGKTKLVTSRGVSDIKNELTGYTIVKAKSHVDAAKIFKSNPQVRWRGGKIEIMACISMG